MHMHRELLISSELGAFLCSPLWQACVQLHRVSPCHLSSLLQQESVSNMADELMMHCSWAVIPVASLLVCHLLAGDRRDK